MFLIQDTLVSLDLVERFFACDLDKCLGQCCIDGDAGAPLLESEKVALENHIQEIKPLLKKQARDIIEEEGVSYIDQEGELVTSLINGCECVFTHTSSGGKCLCALEKATREGKLPQLKPISCHLYPVRLKKIGNMNAVNLHKWKICRPAETNGRQLGIRAYQFLKEPLIRRFGPEWYAELERVAHEWLQQNKK